MKIGELARRLGINTKTIRFYESIDLIPPADRTPSGYRDYGEEDADRLAFIKSAQRFGLSLEEISEILALRERGERPCDYVLGVVQGEISDLDHRIKEMRALRKELVELVGRARELPDDGGYCRLLSHRDVSSGQSA